MQIAKVTASWSETCSLGNYSNVKPSLTLEATIEPGEDAAEVSQRLTGLCRMHVQELINEALEGEDQPAKYWEGLRFDVLAAAYDTGNRFVIVAPARTEWPRELRVYADVRGFRRQHARDYARSSLERRMGGDVTYTLLDCSDGDLEPVLLALRAELAAEEQKKAVEQKRREQIQAERAAPAVRTDDDEDDEDEE